MKKNINIEDYWALEALKITKNEAKELFGEDVITYKRKSYIPKDVCRLKILNYLRNHGDVEWETDPILLNIR